MCGRETGSALCRFLLRSQGWGIFWPSVMKSFWEGSAEGGPHGVVSQASASNGDFQTETLPAQYLERHGNSLGITPSSQRHQNQLPNLG